MWHLIYFQDAPLPELRNVSGCNLCPLAWPQTWMVHHWLSVSTDPLEIQIDFDFKQFYKITWHRVEIEQSTIKKMYYHNLPFKPTSTLCLKYF